jgi:hypothetical protein
MSKNAMARRIFTIEASLAQFTSASLNKCCSHLG